MVSEKTSNTSCPAATETGFSPDTRMRSGPTHRRVFLLRHKSDTIDLLESGFLGCHELQRRFAQRQGAGGARRRLQLAGGSARHDQLAQVVVEDQQFAYRLASLESGAAALAAAVSLAGLAERAHQPL